MDYTLHPTISQDEWGVLKAYVKFPAENEYYFQDWLLGHFTNTLLGRTVH